MNFTYRKYVFIVIMLFFAFSCKKPVSLPPEPVIEFVSIRTIDTVDNPELRNPITYNQIEFSLIDGDGDIGNDPDKDTSRNVFVTVLKKENGIFSEHTIISINRIDTIPLEFIMPETPISGGLDKSLKAHVFINLETFNLLPQPPLYPLPFDTLKYELYVTDRAGNKSNIIETKEVIIPRK